MLRVIIDDLPPEVREALMNLTPAELLVAVLIVGLGFVFILLFYIGICWFALKLNARVFRRIERKNGNSITLQFLQKAVALALIIVFVVFPLGGQKLAASLLGSTAVVAAVVGLAANDVIKDMFAGLEISIYKPFDLGSRIMLEDGRCGIVEALTLRHVVLKLVDTTRLIVPNNKANSMLITNYSYLEEVPRSLEVRYSIGYNADIEKAKEIIRTTICDIEITLNKDKFQEGIADSRSVYLLEITDSALVLQATVYYPHDVRTEVILDEVNTKVFEALKENGIELTYECTNVILREDLV